MNDARGKKRKVKNRSENRRIATARLAVC